LQTAGGYAVPLWEDLVFYLMVAVLAFWIGTTDNAYAYLDPGTGSMLLQAAIGTIASALFVVRLYWSKVRAFFSRDSRESTDPSGRHIP
jgi:hypothetical protein